MNEVLAVGLHSMQADMARMDQIAMNLANALTPGFKRGMVVQTAAGANLSASNFAAPSFAAHLSGAAGAGGAPPVVPAWHSHSDRRPGTLKATAAPLDLALAGPGYFEVATPHGPAYTRHGSFRLDATGRLVTMQGHPVMGHAGEITPGTASPSINAAGMVLRAGGSEEAPLAQLKVVAFDAQSPLRSLGDGLLAAGSGMRLVASAELAVRQGFLENANVSSAHEMTEMIRTVRHFESMHKVIQGYEEMLGTAIRKLGETS